MKATVFLGAAALALVAAHETSAQPQPRSEPPAAPVQAIVPPGGLTLNFGDIDRNGDGSISIEEWNAFVASLQTRLGAKDPGGAAVGGTAAPKQPQPQR